MRKAALLCSIVIAGWTLVDVMIWGRMFDDHYVRENLVSLYGWEWLGQYWEGWGLSLTVMLAIGAVALWPDLWAMLWFVIATPLLASSGLEDMLYYWFRLEYLPPEMPWLDDKWWAGGNATSLRLDASVLLCLVFVSALGWLMARWRDRLDAIKGNVWADRYAEARVMVFGDK